MARSTAVLRNDLREFLELEEAGYIKDEPWLFECYVEKNMIHPVGCRSAAGLPRVKLSAQELLSFEACDFYLDQALKVEGIALDDIVVEVQRVKRTLNDFIVARKMLEKRQDEISTDDYTRLCDQLGPGRADSMPAALARRAESLSGWTASPLNAVDVIHKTLKEEGDIIRGILTSEKMQQRMFQESAMSLIATPRGVACGSAEIRQAWIPMRDELVELTKADERMVLFCVTDVFCKEKDFRHEAWPAIQPEWYAVPRPVYEAGIARTCPGLKNFTVLPEALPYDVLEIAIGLFTQDDGNALGLARCVELAKAV